jgi:hypothetical protein
LGFDFAATVVGDVAKQLHQVEALRLQNDLAACDACHVEQAIDESTHIRRLPVDDRPHFGGIGSRQRALLERLDAVQNRPERISQLVTQYGQKFIFVPVGLAESLKLKGGLWQAQSGDAGREIVLREPRDPIVHFRSIAHLLSH